MLKEQKRIIWVDIAKAICMFCVMASHSTFCPKELSLFFTPFFLSLFFFSSGYVYNKEKYSFKELMLRKVKTILVPWLIFGLFNIILSHIVTFNSHESITDEIMYMFLQVRGVNDKIWFLACLFVAFIPFYWIIKKFNKKSILITFFLSLISIIYCKYMNPSVMPFNTVALPWHLQTIFVANFFMCLGYFYKVEYEIKLEKYNKMKFIIPLVCLYLLCVYLNYYYTQTTIAINNYKSNIIVWYIISIMSILMMIYICKRIKSNKLIDFVGKNTILYFCLHGKVLSLLETIISKLNINIIADKNVITQSITTIIIIFLIIIILIIPIIIIEKYFPFVIGRRKIEKEKKNENSNVRA